MATSNSRDVKMTLSVDALGEDGIAKLKGAIEALAKSGGDAAPEFQHLADEVGRLGDQSAALQEFQLLASETATLAAKQEQATVAALELKTKLEALSGASQEARANQTDVAAALAAARTAALTTRDALARLTAMTAEAKAADQGYAVSVSELKMLKIEQRAEIERLSVAMRAANADVAQAEGAENRLAAAYQRSVSAADASAAALRTHESAVAEAARAAQNLGVNTENVATEQGRLIQALNQAGNAAEALQSKVEALAATEKELAAQAAFEKQAEAARRLVVASEYAALFDQALQRLADTQRAMKDQSAADQWQRESFALVEAAAASRKLAHETEVLAAVEKELAAQAAFEKQAEAARRMVEAADYVRFWREELDKAERQAAQTALEAKAAAQKIDDAFRTLGVRSAEDLRTEIQQVRAAMETVRTQANTTGASMAGAFAAGEAKIKTLEREIRRAEGALTASDKAAALLANSMGQIAAGNLVADAVGYLVNKVKELGRAFVEAIVQVDQLRRGLGAIYNSADITAKQIDFLRRASMEAGVSVGAISGEFVKFSAAMKASNIPLEDGNNLFKAVTKASAQLGLGAEATAGALNALGQMASKGVVSMEELRQQLGDRLPGAMGLVADGLGITQAQLVKLVESGGLATRDFVVPFTAALNKMKGETDGLLPAWERFKTMLTTVAQTAGDSGWANIMAGALKLLGGAVGGAAIILSGFTESVFLAAKGVVAVAARLMGDKQAFTFFAEEVAKASERLQQQKDALKAMINPASQAADETKKVGVQMKATAEEITLADRAARNVAEAHKLSGSAAAIASDATLNLAGNIVKYNATVNARLAVLKTEVEAAHMAVKAAKEQGDEMVRLAKITGDTTKVHQAEAEASNLVAEAAGKLAAKTKDEVDLMVVQRQHIIEVNNARGVSKEATEAETAELTKKIVKGQAEMEQAQQSANAARAEALQRQLVTEALKDQSSKMYEYRQQVEALTKEVDALTERQKRGENVDAALKEAREKLAAATYRYRDAVNDAIRAIDLEAQKKKATLTVDEQLSTAAEKHYLALAKEAKAMGDTTLARQYEAAAIGEQIKAIQKKIEIAELELAAEEKRLKMQRELLTGDDDATRAKREQIDIELKLLEGKRAGIQGLRDELAERERERQAILSGNDARAAELKARDANIAAMNAETAALKEQNDAIENNNKEKQRAIDLENKRLGRDSEGFSVGPDGKRIVATYTTYSERAIYERAKKEGLTDEQALDIAKRYIAQDQAPNLSGYAGGPTQTWDYRLTEDINKLVLANARAKANSEKGVDQYGNPLQKAPGSEQGRAGSSGGQEAQQGGGTSGTGSSHTVNINIGGNNTPINVASPQDANNLTSVLRQLESASKVAR